MANLLGILVIWITFPGVILHEWSHKFFCDRAGIPVYEVKYFRFGNPAGYVLHGEVTRYRDAFLITIAPFIVNTLFAIAMFIVPALNIDATLKIPFIWLGLSFAIHAFPSDGDAKSMWSHSKRMWRKNPVALIGFPLVIIIVLVNMLRFFWIDFIYGVALMGVTFVIVSAIVASGTPLFPGLAAMVVSPTPTPHPTSTYHYTQDNPAPTIPRPTPVQDLPDGEASAKEWLSIADKAMKQENSNAVLIYIHGYSSDHGTVLPVNGKSHEWWYQYIVPDQDKIYNVYVHDGVLKSLSEGKTANGNVPIGNWTVDSDDVIAVANADFKERTGNDPVSVSYVLEGSYVPDVKGKPTWTVGYYDSTTRVIANLQVDLETCQVVYAWIPPGT